MDWLSSVSAAMDRVNEEMEDQVEEVTGVGQVTVCHRLVNCLHDGKERLAAVESNVATYLEQGIVKKREPGVYRYTVSFSGCYQWLCSGTRLTIHY